MKIKLDENIPARLAPFLTELGHSIDTVFGEGLVGRPDDEVWLAAQHEGRFLITQDLDFSDARIFAPGHHAGILLIRCRAPGRNEIVQRIQTLFAAEAVEGWRGCFVVATDRKLRIRRP